eukprot:SAG22_NODE_1397_length_4507_cov_56.156534_4_plen_50_part_00
MPDAADAEEVKVKPFCVEKTWEQVGNDKCLQQRMPACQPMYDPKVVVPL